jgi:hypothetical protein
MFVKATEVALFAIGGLLLGYLGQRWVLGPPVDEGLVRERIHSGQLRITARSRRMILTAVYVAIEFFVLATVLQVAGVLP